MAYQITIKQQYSYVTEEKTEDVERTVYTQRVDDLDIKQVIDAVNAKTYNPGQPPVVVKGQADGTQPQS